MIGPAGAVESAIIKVLFVLVTGFGGEALSWGRSGTETAWRSAGRGRAAGRPAARRQRRAARWPLRRGCAGVTVA